MGKRLRAVLIHSTALALCLFAFAALAGSAAAETVTLPVSGTVKDLKHQAIYRPDPDGILSAGELISSDKEFVPYNFAWEDNAPPMWIKLRFNAEANNKQYVLLVKRRFFPALQVFANFNPGGLRQLGSGSNASQGNSISGHSFAYKLTSGSDGTVEILLFVKTVQNSLAALEFYIQDQVTFEQTRTTNYWAFGLYFGAMLALIFYNFILYLNLRTPGHRHYVATMVFVILLMSMNAGLLQGYLPGFLANRSHSLTIFLSTLATAATCAFFQVFTISRHYIPRTHNFISAIIGIFLVLSAAAALTPTHEVASLAMIAQPLSTTVFLVLIISSLIAGLSGSSSGYIFLVAWLAFVLGSVIWSLVSLDYISRTPATDYALYIGSVMEAMILALGLSYRVGQLRTQRNRALREQQKAARLANIDPLTGAYNRRFIENYLEGLLNAEDKRAFQGSLIMLDMDKFKPVNDEFGHAAGDAVLNEMASRCLDTIRSEDVLARLGGDEFAIVLLDQSGHDAQVVAERLCTIISDKPATFGMQSIPMSVSVGVVTKFESSATAYSAFKHADQALYEAKHAGRNCVVVFTGGDEPAPKAI